VNARTTHNLRRNFGTTAVMALLLMKNQGYFLEFLQGTRKRCVHVQVTQCIRDGTASDTSDSEWACGWIQLSDGLYTMHAIVASEAVVELRENEMSLHALTGGLISLTSEDFEIRANRKLDELFVIIWRFSVEGGLGQTVFNKEQLRDVHDTKYARELCERMQLATSDACVRSAAVKSGRSDAFLVRVIRTAEHFARVTRAKNNVDVGIDADLLDPPRFTRISRAQFSALQRVPGFEPKPEATQATLTASQWGDATQSVSHAKSSQRRFDFSQGIDVDQAGVDNGDGPGMRVVHVLFDRIVSCRSRCRRQCRSI
jgi:hypothetical protein